MTKEEKDALDAIAYGDPFKLRPALKAHLKTVQVSEPVPEPENAPTGENTPNKGIRTMTQNRALHLGLGMIAKSLNESGKDMRVVLKPEVHIDWDTETVKEYLFRPIMKLTCHVDSTTELKKTGDIEKAWDTMMRFLGENHGIEYIEFPNDPVKGIRLSAMDNLSNENYPEHIATAFDDQV